MMGQALIDRGNFVDVGHSTSLAHLRDLLAPRLVHYRLAELDAATIRLSAPRSFTQEVSRVVFESVTEDGSHPAGIHYLSRLGDEIHNWAIFEGAPAVIGELDAIRLQPNDTDLEAALEILHVEFV